MKDLKEDTKRNEGNKILRVKVLKPLDVVGLLYISWNICRVSFSTFTTFKKTQFVLLLKCQAACFNYLAKSFFELTFTYKLSNLFYCLQTLCSPYN
jgi:hypothetical protein